MWCPFPKSTRSAGHPRSTNQKKHMSNVGSVTLLPPTSTTSTTGSATQALTQADFLQLMVAQFTQQDPLASDGSGDGGSTSDYVNQLMSMTNRSCPARTSPSPIPAAMSSPATYRPRPSRPTASRSPLTVSPTRVRMSHRSINRPRKSPPLQPRPQPIRPRLPPIKAGRTCRKTQTKQPDRSLQGAPLKQEKPR
jgi:hypothetical protein